MLSNGSSRTANTFYKKGRLMTKLAAYCHHLRKENQNGTMPRGFILNQSNKCNFHCKHCFTKSSLNENCDPQLSADDIKRLADQADSLGVYEVDIQGGEPLLNPMLFDILSAIDTKRFYTYITTNGWLLDEVMAGRLQEAGVDRITVSIDSFTSEEFDAFRGMPGAYKRALQALENTEKAGMKPYVNIVTGHYNAQSRELDSFCAMVKSKNWGIAFNAATPTGSWQGNYDVMLQPEDSNHLLILRKKYKNIIRDLWDYTDTNQVRVSGCPAVNLFYVNPKGDVLPCPYIHTSLGNIKKQSLEEILTYGFRIRYFRDYSSLCLAGENQIFAKKYLNNPMSILDPLPLNQIFPSTDFYDE